MPIIQIEVNQRKYNAETEAAINETKGDNWKNLPSFTLEELWTELNDEN
jgi:hypothetical protein